LVQSETDLLLAGEEKEITLTIDWPSGSEVVLTAKWSIDQEIFTSSQSYTSGVISSSQSYEIPWVGLISGIAIAGVVILVMRLKNSSSERTTSSSATKSKTPKSKKSVTKSKTSVSTKDRKVQVGCPECARQLRVPASYSGTVRCPDCSNRFDVTSRDETPQEEEEEVEEIEEQEKKEVSCPDCSQALRVPTDYSGSVRCPACKVVFKAISQ
jgi:ribosomal protein L37AE/L43A